jgi:hypothetical protein
MTEEELNAIVESKLEARLAARMQAERARLRAEVAAEIRREAERAHYDKINARHPSEDKYGGLGPEGHAARLREMDARARADMASMDASNARSVAGDLRAQRAAHKGGGAGFKIKG